MPGTKPVGRFQVMAVLQAARALCLGLSEDSSKSWGLNRAIFYAAAKRGFKAFRMKRPVAIVRGAKITREEYDEALDGYYDARGWTREGIPTMTKLRELGLQKEAEEITQALEVTQDDRT